MKASMSSNIFVVIFFFFLINFRSRIHRCLLLIVVISVVFYDSTIKKLWN